MLVFLRPGSIHPWKNLQQSLQLQTSLTGLGRRSPLVQPSLQQWEAGSSSSGTWCSSSRPSGTGPLPPFGFRSITSNLVICQLSKQATLQWCGGSRDSGWDSRLSRILPSSLARQQAVYPLLAPPSSGFWLLPRLLHRQLSPPSSSRSSLIPLWTPRYSACPKPVSELSSTSMPSQGVLSRPRMWSLLWSRLAPSPKSWPLILCLMQISLPLTLMAR